MPDSEKPEPKIKCSHYLTVRQVNGVKTAARMWGIEEGDVVRRVLDGWMDGVPVLSPVPPDPNFNR